ncbi:MAG TPA: PilZ domain-containing protein [Anaeromyxobacter sp.]
MHSVSVVIEPAQYLASWREKNGTVFLPVLSDTRVGDEVAVRVGILGHAIRATLSGRVALVRRMGRPSLPPGIDLQLERNSLAAAYFLAAAARGVPVPFQERAPRWVAELPLAIERGGAKVEVMTLNLSEGGCAVRWPGQLPLVGDELAVRLKEGLFPLVLRSVVCWNLPGSDRDRSVGLKILPDGRAARAWKKLVDGVGRSGAHPA